MNILSIIMSFITMLMSILGTVLPGFGGDTNIPDEPDDDIVIEEQIDEKDMTPEQLQEKYSFYYYRDFNEAFTDINNEEVGVNTVNKENNPDTETLVGVYVNDNEEINVVALADSNIENKIFIYRDCTVNLGGHTILFTATPTGFDIRNATENPDDIVTVNFNGRVDGSTIQVDYDNAAAIVSYQDTIVNIDEGNYIARSLATNVDENYLAPNGRKYQTRVLYCATDSEMNVNDVDIKTNVHCGNAYGIVNQGTLNIEDAVIYADAQYSDDGVDYIYLSVGIQNSGSATVKNCDVTGTHSGISSSGALYVDGGNYQSIGHGGIYVSGNGKTAYIQNADLKAIEYDGQYEVKPETTNNVGFYIGGNVGHDNLTAYIDNCTFYGTRAPFALRGSSGEKNNTVYISNSKINTDAKIRIDNDTHTLYLGTGNNFTAENTTRPARVIVTDQQYHTDF